MKKYLAVALAFVLALSLLVGCNGSFSVAVVNDSGYIFNEMYISPTADNSWGDDQLGSTRVLKSGGTYEIKIPQYEYDTYDIRIIDEDGDEYLFERAKLVKDCEIIIGFASDLYANVVYEDGTFSQVVGKLNGGGTADAGAQAATDKEFFFGVYNESAFDILAIYMGPADASSDTDVDVLPEILKAGERTDITGTVPEDMASITEWTLYIKDADGDTSNSYDVFDPFNVVFVDIYWDSAASGYRCEFTY